MYADRLVMCVLYTHVNTDVTRCRARFRLLWTNRAPFVERMSVGTVFSQFLVYPTAYLPPSKTYIAQY